MTKRDYLETWGFMELLKTTLNDKAKAAAQRGDDRAAGGYLRDCDKITALKKKIDAEAEAME